MRDQPFSASSTLLFALVPGAGTSTNRPELFAQRGRPTTARRPPSRRRRIACRSSLLSAGDGYSTLRSPDVGNLRLLKRTVRLTASASRA